MDANRTRFHLLLGRADWAAVREDGATLAERWSAPPPAAPSAFAWDAETHTIGLRPRLMAFRSSATVALPPSARRGAGRDRYGNLYWISDDESEVRVLSAGSRLTSRFWAACAHVPPIADFIPVEPPAAVAPLRLSGLAVTADHHLVVGVIAPVPGLLLFDLHGTGEPRRLDWPAAVAFAPFDLAPAPGGGCWVLDRANRRLWQLDRAFAVVPPVPAAPPPPAPPLDPLSGFMPVAVPPPPPGSPPAAPPPMCTALSTITDAAAHPLTLADPVAVETLPDGTQLVLDRDDAGGTSTVHRYRAGIALGVGVSTDAMRDLIDEDSRAAFTLVGHDLAVVPEHVGRDGAIVGDRLYVMAATAEQAFAFALGLDPADRNQLVLDPRSDYLPLRLSQGRGLIGGGFIAAGCAPCADAERGAHGCRAFYDSGVAPAERWLLVAAQVRPRFAVSGMLLSPGVGDDRVFDGKAPGCVWHRLFIDACIPNETAIAVSSRAADEAGDLAATPWRREPAFHRRGDGSEQPWVAPFAGTDDADAGTWELLFQEARGRYLQLRLEWTGNGRATPRVRALRAYYPRFSYVDRYLPAAYREDAASASFLERFLANAEGILTATEDRIASAQTLIDVRSAPPEALAWLAGWLGAVLDPSWDNARRRLFIRHAPLFFQLRGTVRGLRLALRLALSPCLDDRAFTASAASDSRPQTPDSRLPDDGIRIIERFRTRTAPGVLIGDPGAIETGPAQVDPAGRWRPELGGDELRRRWARELDAHAAADARAEFPLAAPADANRRRAWESFARTTLGFVPAATAADAEAWTAFLQRRYRDDAARRAVHGPGSTASPWNAVAPSPLGSPSAPMWSAAGPGHATPVASSNASPASPSPATVRTGYRAAIPRLSPPTELPADGPALADWFLFESVVLPMRANAHRFSVLLPMRRGGSADSDVAKRRRDLAARIIDAEKPAHTRYDIRSYWDLFRVGEARLGLSTALDAGGSSARLLPGLRLGEGFVGESALRPRYPQDVPDRLVVGRDRL